MKRIMQVLRRLGPGLITASVVIGPGSIVASSRAGAEGGYRLLWLVGLSTLLMGVYASMGARLGCALEETPLQYVARRAGRPLAALTGLSAFLVTAGFQFGNNMGIAFAAQGVVGAPQYAWVWPIVFTVLALLFLHTASRVYVAIERLMMVLVAVMILCFFANLFWTGLDLPRLMWGLVPQTGGNDLMLVRAIVPTTFSAVAAFYQAYLVQAKGWQRKQIRRAIVDSWVGILAIALISASILAGAAETLSGTTETVGNVGQLALILRKLLGPAAGLVFCLGLGAAAFSSFIVNAVIGGALLADGLGLDGSINSRVSKLLASVVMLIGCAVAVGAFAWGAGTTTSLLLAQASTLVAAPLCALILLVLSSRRSVMGELRNGPATVVVGTAGLLVILALGIMWALD